MSVGAYLLGRGGSAAGRGDRVFFDSRLRPFYLIIAGLIALLVAVVRLGFFTFEAEPVTSTGVAIAGLALIGMSGRWLTVAILPDVAEAFALFCAVAMLAPLCAVVLASSNLPLADDLLATLDAQLFFGFERHRFVAWLARHPPAIGIAQFGYNSINWQPFLLFIALGLAGRSDRAWAFLFAWIVALVVTLLVFPFVPSLGDAPYDLPWAKVLLHARTGELRSLGAESLTGIVTFPSFHAAAAVLLGWGFAAFRQARVPFIALNALMFVSAIPGGGHYLVDLVAGGLAAAVSIRAAARFMPFAR